MTKYSFEIFFTFKSLDNLIACGDDVLGFAWDRSIGVEQNSFQIFQVS